MDYALLTEELGMHLARSYDASNALDDLEASIYFLAQSLMHTPTSHPYWPDRCNNLGNGLRSKFLQNGSNEDLKDLEEAIESARQVLDAADDERRALSIELGRRVVDHSSSTIDHTHRPEHLVNLAIRLEDRYKLTGSIMDLDQATTFAEEALKQGGNHLSDRANLLNSLAILLTDRYTRTEALDDIQEAVGAARNAVSSTPSDHPNRPLYMKNLAHSLEKDSERNTTTIPLYEAIQISQEALTLLPLHHPDRAGVLSTAGLLLATQDLAKAIEASRQAVEATPEDHPNKAAYLSNLGHLLRKRGENADMEDARLIFATILDSTKAPKVLRIKAGNAHEIARKIIDVISTSAPASMRLIDRQHILFQAVGTASNAAAIALYARKGPMEALKLLETGREVIAGSLQKMRADLSDLRQCFPELASSFEEARGLLEQSSVAGSGASLLVLGPCDFESAAAESDARHKARARVDAVLSEIHRQPGFEHFLGPATETQMRNAAALGPIVVVNMSKYNCSAIIIEKSGIRVLDLEERTYKTVVEDEFLDPFSVDRLEWLWDMIVGPVLDFLGFHKPPSAGEPWPHVWWIPTGPLSKFPLHAAGHHFNNNGTTALDRVISSYSPSVQALVYAREQRVPSCMDKAEEIKIDTSVLGESNLPKESKPGTNAVLVSIPKRPGHLWQPRGIDDIEEVRQACESMGLSCHQPIIYQKDLVAALYDSCRVFHFAGDSTSSRNNPMESQLHLEDWKTKTLTAGDLLGMNLHANPPFLAFLSANATGRVLGRRAEDENIHLARAFQLAGFRHVIGTLGRVYSELSLETAKMTYQALCDGGMTDVAVSEGLHHALRQLRDDWVRSNAFEMGGQRDPDSNITPPLWAVYVHFGP
ncbi:hypothetical protein LX36DRAFT_694410 [Colletotrichum falcatum]|nr:hypothetical protein LX36DRAFT_694410 [Colletotrichum falcatum]